MRVETIFQTIDAETAGLYELSDDEFHRLQGIMTDMLSDVSAVCEAYDISWSLFGGSALGAVRHGGFIPWDDDVDIYMTRRNYEKLKSVFDKELSGEYVLKEPGDKDYLMHYPKIYKRGTIAKPILTSDEAESGFFIDIFPMEDTYDGKLRRNLHGLRCNAYRFIDSVLRMERCKENLLKYGADDPTLSKELKRRVFFAKFFHFRSLEEWLRRSDKCFSKVKNPSSKLVAAPSGVLRFFGELYLREKMETLVEIPFNGKNFFIMKDYNYYLRKRYGEDYMDIPFESKRERHIYIKFDFSE